MRSMRLPVVLSCSLAAFSALPIPSPIPMFRAVAAEAQDSNAVVAARKLQAVPANRTVTLDPPSSEELAVASLAEGSKAPSKVPENFRRFDAVDKGQIGDTKTLTLRFAAGAKLLTIKSTAEFKVEQGGSCVEGFSYAANSTCTLLVRSTPQGPGRRLGKLEIANSVDAKPLYVGLGGNGYAPTISFTPSIISTVPGTNVSGTGIFSGATSLAMDGGDTLYIADTGNNKVDFIDSSGTIRDAGFTSARNPTGVGVDSTGAIYITQRNVGYLSFISPGYYDTFTAGSNACGFGDDCSLVGEDEFIDSYIGAMAADPSGTLFLNGYFDVGQLGTNEDYILLDTPVFTNNNVDYPYSPFPLAVDSSDTIYTFYNGGGGYDCRITGESNYNARNQIDDPVIVAGGQRCGFSGDGGQARGAEIGALVGQMDFDIAGNLYFSDTLNNRVRRIDGATGIITTIAGNGSIGYAGDGAQATSASLNAPTGVAVDSQGQVYILSNSATTGSAQVVRKVGVVGALNLGGQAVGTASTAQTVQLANTGNSELDFTHVGFSSGNTTDFAIDPNTTSCNFTVALAAGRSCKIGFIFTPSAIDNRSAVLSITDDTIAGLNTIQLSGVGYTTATLTPASLTYAGTTVGSSSASQTATLTNTGKAAIAISGIALSGAAATSYIDTTTCGTTLAVGASCTIAVTFKPTTTGTLAATLSVTDNALGGRQTVSLTGIGSAAVAKASLSSTSLAFGSQTVAVASAAKTITLSNTGGASMTISSYAFSGTNSADFTETTTCVSPLAAGASCTINVVFKPAAAGSRSATLTINTAGGNVAATLTGTGAAAATVPHVALMSMANPMPANTTLMLTAEVIGSSTAKPTGSVQLLESSKVLAEGTLNGGAITFKLAGMTPGIHLLDAIYLGDAKNPKMTSAILRQVMQAGNAPIFGPVRRVPLSSVAPAVPR